LPTGAASAASPGAADRKDVMGKPVYRYDQLIGHEVTREEFVNLVRLDPRKVYDDLTLAAYDNDTVDSRVILRLPDGTIDIEWTSPESPVWVADSMEIKAVMMRQGRKRRVEIEAENKRLEETNPLPF
jgi:hypothetical protein